MPRWPRRSIITKLNGEYSAPDRKHGLSFNQGYPTFSCDLGKGDLGSLGFDSLSCLEVVRLLTTQCGLTSVTNASGKKTWNLPAGLDLEKRLWCLQKGVSSHSPLVLVHDGSGLAACYRHISNMLNALISHRFRSRSNICLPAVIPQSKAGIVKRQ